MIVNNLITIIVPVYNVGPYLCQCLDSIIHQTYKQLEILLIDDGSQDESAAICDSYAEKDERIRVFHNENKGVSATRNFGLEEAKGEYVGFIDSDDWIEPDMYEVMLKEMEENGADVCICGFAYEGRKTGTVTFSSRTVMTGKDSLAALVSRKIACFVVNKLYRRTVLDSVSFPDMRCFEDTSFMHEVLNNAKTVVMTNSVLYHYRKSDQSLTATYSVKKLIDFADSRFSRYNFLETRHKDLLQEYNDVIMKYMANCFARIWRYWYGFSREETDEYSERISEMKKFTRDHFPLFGYHSWPKYLRLTSFFMHSDSRLSFAVSYMINKIHLKLHPKEDGKDDGRVVDLNEI